MKQLLLTPPRVVRSVSDIVAERLQDFVLRQRAREARRRRGGIRVPVPTARPGKLWEEEEHLSDRELLAQFTGELEVVKAQHGDQAVLYLDIGTTWILICALQLAARHPELKEDTRRRLERVIADLSRPFSGPAAQEMLRRGWGG